jgi:hypothetical protein
VQLAVTRNDAAALAGPFDIRFYTNLCLTNEMLSYWKSARKSGRTLRSSSLSPFSFLLMMLMLLALDKILYLVAHFATLRTWSLI